ncbi:SDR family NAD(P)-dependent oxidoreductase [Kribbella catacumbae]|uniref:SDR family NAD(P)-dependent oxidoreductase n=1 Tax=Kribbella catacumbae TaxID=460086 RepID=UPI00058BF90C|nr:SDR family NAD(P)-dependent oxidoreductase [Kribbella catacumbae]
MRTVVVTGASGGIGAAIVRLLLERGDRVLAIGRSAEKLAALHDAAAAPPTGPAPRPPGGEPAPLRLGGEPGSDAAGELVPVVIDLARPADFSGYFEGLGELDALVHCAGIAEVASVEETGPDLWQRTLTVNLTSAAELTRVLLPPLRARRGGVVFVNLAPRMGVVPRWSAYVGSKAALTELADVLRSEEKQNGVRVTTVYPGGTATELLKEVRTQFGGSFTPEDCLALETVAQYVLLALDAPPDGYLTDLSIAPIAGKLRRR